jgi:general stress protein 26
MDVESQTDQGMAKVAELVKEIKFGMLTTQCPDGSLHSRPMSTLQMDEDGCLWFFTSQHSTKIEDIDDQYQVNMSYARTDKQDYLSVTGTAEVVRNRKKMESLWTPWLKPWFQDGLDDPELILLKVRVDAADYWDAPGSAAKRLYGLAKGAMTGDTDALGEHGHVRNPSVRH